MKILAFIPARGGSVGLKNKNLINLAGKPLIQYTFDTIKKLGKTVYPFVSTNDKKIANYNTHKINSLMSNTNIIRNKLKILSAISNAKCLIQVRQNHKGFYNYINKIKISLFNKSYQEDSIDTGLELSKIVYQRMRNDKFKFIGPIIINSFLMSSGFIDGHESNCFMYYENQNGKSSSSSD